jgi:hypothetical protein
VTVELKSLQQKVNQALADIANHEAEKANLEGALGEGTARRGAGGNWDFLANPPLFDTSSPSSQSD